MRKLASIQQISEIIKHENADIIEIVKVLGWRVVCKKGLFNVGDLCVYFEIDSVLPSEQFASFEFLKNSKFRLRTIKLRGEISQGLVVSIKQIESLYGITLPQVVGEDITDLLKIEKYEPPEIFKVPNAEGLFPSFLIEKTDETRIQAIPELLDEIKGIDCIATVKYDGTSITLIKNLEKDYVCSRNLSLKKEENDDSAYFKIADKVLPFLSNNYTIQGELCGPGIAKNKCELNFFKMFVFNIINMDNRKLLTHEEMKEFIVYIKNRLFNADIIDVVDIAYDMPNFSYSLEELLKLSEGTYRNTLNTREGIVIRSKDPNLYSKVLKSRLSFKVINNEFLLKNKDS